MEDTLTAARCRALQGGHKEPSGILCSAASSAEIRLVMLLPRNERI
jgi:hypothetical protein